MTAKRRRFIAASLVIAGSVATTLALAQAGGPKVEAAWARPTVNGQSGGGGFLKITGGSTPDRLISATANVSKVVELHTMEMDGNVMRMRAIEAIDIPAGQVVELKPGGKHVMFLGLTQTLKSGARFPVTLRFEKAGEVKVDMQVMSAPADAAKPAHDMAKH
jgi:periplasmic copper chaperone A